MVKIAIFENKIKMKSIEYELCQYFQFQLLDQILQLDRYKKSDMANPHVILIK